MTTRTLVMILTGVTIIGLSSTTKINAEDSPSTEVSKSAPDSTHNTIESVNTAKETFVAVRSKIENKVEVIKAQQKEIKDTQKQIDSLTELSRYCSK